MGCVKFDTAHFILYIFTLYTVLCTQYSVLCTLFSVLCTLFSVGFAQVATVRCVITNTFALHSLTRNFLCTLFSLLVQQEYARNLG